MIYPLMKVKYWRPYYCCIAVYFSLQVCYYLLCIFRWPNVGCIYIAIGCIYILLMSCLGKSFLDFQVIALFLFVRACFSFFYLFNFLSWLYYRKIIILSLVFLLISTLGKFLYHLTLVTFYNYSVFTLLFYNYYGVLGMKFGI